MTSDAFYRLTELDRTTWPEVRDQILTYSQDGPVGQPRAYPGYPRWPLARCRPRVWPALERMLWSRRSESKLSTELPSLGQLSRLLQFSHGVGASAGRGPTPSAGGLQALELYLVNFVADWLPAGLYHYDRAGHALTQSTAGAQRDDWRRIVPSLELVEGGAILWIIVGDGQRCLQKYAERGWRFLLLEAGHLMQNLCLMSQRLGWTTTPLGGFFEQPIANAFTLPKADAVLYLGMLGKTSHGSTRMKHG